MADIEISYNNSTIVSMNDSGTEVLETNGKVCADDITIVYTKSGGGVSVSVTVSEFTGDIYYVDAADGEVKVGARSLSSQSVPDGSMLALLWDGPKAPGGATLVNCTVVYSVSNGMKATYPYIDICIAGLTT